MPEQQPSLWWAWALVGVVVLGVIVFGAVLVGSAGDEEVEPTPVVRRVAETGPVTQVGEPDEAEDPPAKAEEPTKVEEPTKAEHPPDEPEDPPVEPDPPKPQGVEQAGVATPGPPRYLPPAVPGRVEYLIITSDTLREAWRPWAVHKTQLGLPADVVTTSQIRRFEPACDTPASIRRFVRRLHREHGLKWLLLGGDVAHVPGRYLVFRHGKLGVKPYVADGYYGCLRGDWNADHDHEFGERGTDGVSLNPQVYVGRITAETPRDVEGWIAKSLLYVRPKHRDYQKRALFIGADVFTKGDAERYYTQLGQQIFKSFGVTPLMPKHKNSNERTAFAEISRGHGIISHYQHSYMYNIGLAKGAITVYNVGKATNAERPSVMFSNGCNVCQFDYKSIGEALLMAPKGGVVAIIGSSETNFAHSLRYEVSTWTRVFGSGTPLGQALAFAKRDNQPYFCSTALSLLGDPALRVWTDTPKDLAVEHAKGTVTTAPGATVCLSGPGYHRVGLADDEGRWSYEAPMKGMKATLTASLRGHVSATRAVQLKGSGAPALVAFEIDGKRIEPKDGVFRVSRPKVTCVFGRRWKGTARIHGGLVPQEFALDERKRVIEWDASGRSVFPLTLSSGQQFLLVLPRRDPTVLVGYTPSTKSIDVRVVASDAGPAEVTVAIDSEHATVASNRTPGVFGFRWGREDEPAFRLRVAGQIDLTRRVDLSRRPAPPTNLTAQPGIDRVRLGWVGPVGLRRAGYLVYRIERSGAPRLLTPKPIEHPTFMDIGLRGLTSYRYRVRAVDDGLIGQASNALEVSTTMPPLRDWPKRTDAQMGTVVLADLDDDGKPELLAGDAGKGLWVWRNDGSEWRHGGDNWTFGLFRAVEGGVFTPTVADLDGDGKPELVTAGLMRNSNVYVWKLDGTPMKGWPQKVGPRKMTPPRVVDLDGDGKPEVVMIGGFGKGLWIWNADGTPFGKQARVTQIGQYNYFMGPIMNLDRDKQKEIVVLDGAGMLQVLKPDGSSLPGFPVKVGHPGRASVCAGDVDGDGKPELVCLARGGSLLSVIGTDGKVLEGWPISLTKTNANHSASFPALAQMDDEPGLEIIVGNHEKKLYVYDGRGKLLPGWPLKLDGVAASIAVADIVPGGAPEIIAAGMNKRVYAFDAAGKPVRGFPLETNGRNRGVPFLGDFDGDGGLDLLLGSQDGHVYAWSLKVPFKNSALRWNGQSNGLNHPGYWYARKDVKRPWAVPRFGR